MSKVVPKKKSPIVKSELHPRNKHRGLYNFKDLISTCPSLGSFVKINDYGNESIDFFNPDAVKSLNKALLQHFYGIKKWDIPKQYLCPPIPGRADYIHYLADLIGDLKNVNCLDIGTAANCVYPLIGASEYGWSFVGSEIDPNSIESANKILDANPILGQKIELRLQENSKRIFEGIINKNEYYDLTLCNPPFHASQKEAMESATRKLSNLKGKRKVNPVLNFGGRSNELWCKGGERQFIMNMIQESKQIANSCKWFTTLVSKKETLSPIYRALEAVDAIEVKTIPMGQGHKVSRFVAWTFEEKE